MKILYHHRTQAEDGQAVHIRSLIRAFQEAGHEVREVGLVEHGQEPGEEVTVEERARWGWVRKLPRIAREIAEYGYNSVGRQRILKEAAHFEPDFIYERYAFGNAAGVMAANKLGIPLVLEVNSPLVEELEGTRGLSLPGMAKKVEDWVFTNADRVCVVSGVLRDMLRAMGVAEDRLVLTPNGVHPADFAFGDRGQVRYGARIDLGIPEGGAVIGFVGYYRDWHRLDVVLEALARPELQRARFVIVGEGPAREHLEQRATELGVRERVFFAPPRGHERIPRILTAFDIAVVPAINPYASPLKLHEYMAGHLPIIAPDQPNIREVVTHEEHALLVPPGDVDAMTAAILAIGKDRALRTALGEAAYNRVLELDLTWAGNARRVLSSVAPLLGLAPEEVLGGEGAA